MNDDLSPDLKDLFDAERRRDDVPAGAKDRVHAALAASIGVGVMGTGAGIAKGGALAKGSGAAAAAAKAAAGTGAAAASGAAAVSGAAATAATATAATGATAAGGIVAKGLAIALVAAMAGTAGTGVWLAQRDEKKPAPTETVVPTADVPSTFDPSILGRRPPPAITPPTHATAHEAPEAVTKPVEHAAPVVEQAAPVARAPETPEQRAVRLAGERAVLDDARSAVARGEPGAALIALEAHRARYPDGNLVEEREALTILALAKLGRLDDARAKAARFRDHYAASLFLGAIDAALK